MPLVVTAMIFSLFLAVFRGLVRLTVALLGRAVARCRLSAAAADRPAEKRLR